MCGLFGRLTAGVSGVKEDEFLHTLAMFASYRGLDSYGLAAIHLEGSKLKVRETRKTHAITLDIHEKDVTALMRSTESNLVIGHTRAATVGDVSKGNCMPYFGSHIIGTHNGTLKSIVRDKASASDSMIFFAGLDGSNDPESVLKKLVQGDDAAALVWFDRRSRRLSMWRNEKRPLHLFQLNASTADSSTATPEERMPSLFWASEKWMLQAAANRVGWSEDRYTLSELKENTLVSFRASFQNKKYGRGELVNPERKTVIALGKRAESNVVCLPYQAPSLSPEGKRVLEGSIYRTRYEEASKELQRSFRPADTARVPDVSGSALLPWTEEPEREVIGSPPPSQKYTVDTGPNTIGSGETEVTVEPGLMFTIYHPYLVKKYGDVDTLGLCNGPYNQPLALQEIHQMTRECGCGKCGAKPPLSYLLGGGRVFWYSTGKKKASEAYVCATCMKKFRSLGSDYKSFAEHVDNNIFWEGGRYVTIIGRMSSEYDETIIKEYENSNLEPGIKRHEEFWKAVRSIQNPAEYANLDKAAG